MNVIILALLGVFPIVALWFAIGMGNLMAPYPWRKV
jgi:hypothetical protein